MAEQVRQLQARAATPSSAAAQLQAMLEAPRRSPSWLNALRDAGRETLRQTPWPTRKTEAWKYTNLRALEEGGFAGAPPLPAAGEPLADYYAIAGFDSLKLVFVNGRFASELSSAEFPEGLECVRFSQANDIEAERIRRDLGQVMGAAGHLFSALNDARLEEGLYLRVRKNLHLEQPIQIVWLTTAAAQSFTVAQRLLVVLEEGSQARVLEQFVSSPQAQNSFTHGVTELLVHANASLEHCRLHLEQEDALHIGGVYARLERNSRLRGFHLALGGALKRIDLVIDYQGPGAECVLNGVYLARHQQHIDYHSCIEHAVPACTTHEVFRGIIGDRAKAVFNGRIHIHPQAQKTSAQLSNKNLLTSAEAEVDTKPELEIYADDVRCAHGATVSQPDETALYYLRARGISKAEAEVALSFAFINELINRVDDQALCDYLRPRLIEFLERDPKLLRHLG